VEFERPTARFKIGFASVQPPLAPRDPAAGVPALLPSQPPRETPAMLDVGFSGVHRQLILNSRPGWGEPNSVCIKPAAANEENSRPKIRVERLSGTKSKAANELASVPVVAGR